MKQIKKKILSMVAALLAILALTHTALAAEGTQGDEMQVMEAQKLEIQLGTDWAGVEFQFKTDAGLYPGTVTVGVDGVLYMEIGGSKSYVLTCLNSSVKAPKPAQVTATKETDKNMERETLAKIADGTDVQKPKDNIESGEDINPIAGIPISHVILFAGGMVLAVGGLIIMHVMKKRRESENGYPEEEE